MLHAFRASRSNVLVWILMVLLIIGLAGFGITTAGTGGQAVVEVGDSTVEADEFSRAMDQELRAIGQQLGRQLPMTEARSFGIDRMVLARMAGDAALDEAASGLGLSSGDATVQELVLRTPAFQGPGGAFDPEAYRFALDRIGLTPSEFEATLRAEATRDLLAAGLQSAAAMPASAADALLAHAGETRRFDWIALDAAALPEPVPAPTDAEIAAEYEAHPERYVRPETRTVSYALLDPETLAATIEIPEEELRAAYEASGARFDIPERRAVERIAFGTPEEAAAALARITSGETDFDAVAAERGLAPADIDEGEVRAADLSAEAAAAVFGAEGAGAVVGPAVTPLGPSLYRVNAILAPVSTPFEEARAVLARERALQEADARIPDETHAVEDLLAGGARIEEIAEETGFEAGTITFDATATEGLGADPAFRDAAFAADPDVETDLVELANGGVATLRVDAITPEAPIPLEEARDRVAADWTAAETARRLAALGRDLAAEIDGGASLADVAARFGTTVLPAGPLGRTQIVGEGPEGLVAAVFAAEPAKAATAAAGAQMAVAQVTEVIPFDPAAPGNPPVVESLREQLDEAAAADALELFVRAVQAQEGVRVDQDLVERILIQFP